MNTNTNSFPFIRGYAIVEPLSKGSRTAVYRALRTESQQPVVIKVLCNEHPSFGELVQFRNQYAIARHLNHPALVSPLALERCGNAYALVMADQGFISLATYCQQDSLDVSAVLAIAIQLADALHYLISQRIIHKDIKPANILIHPETLQIQLIDFSIASLLPKEQQQLVNPNILEGTLAYISPEQTGRMNRGIDYRTDFYSLGVTLFELLTGKLPFPTDDPIELVHSHIACPVVFPEANPQNIPEMVQAIILKLMSKNVEDRYQSALGLQHDLERCLDQWKGTGDISVFELGARDISDRFVIPERLYGREAEVQTLLDAFDRVAIPPQSAHQSQSAASSGFPLTKGDGRGRSSEGGSEMMLVAGFSGIGKTAVVNEVHKPITRQKGYFIQGKFDQFNRNIPFSGFVQALRDLMGQLLSESDTQLQQWKEQILDAVGEQGQVIIEVIPELERIIGQQPTVPELSGSAAQNRFNLLFGKFIQVFTTKEHPLVIFLDDLQWADSASLNLMKLLMSETTNSYLLMIGAYRDNEVFPAHPLILTLDEIAKEEGKINTINLAPLSEENINHLVADTLSCHTEVAKPLTELVYQKTKGNPFFTTQFLLGLYGDELIQFNFEFGYWECEITEVRQQALTDDVVEFMAGRLQKLPEETQAVLKLAACIGNQFDLATLAIVSEKSKEDTADSLWKALQEGLILPQSEVYKFYLGERESGNQDGSSQVVNYKFLHDRVQQAAYSLIPQGEKQATHLHIGRLLSKNLSQEQQNTNIFIIINHWNQAIELIADPTEVKKLIQLNYSAGEKAKGSGAYGAALKYFKIALSLLDPVESWETNYPLALKLHENYAEAAYLTGDFELMETIIEQVIEHVQDLLDLVKVHEIKIQAKTAQTQQLSALNIGMEFLALLGIEVPESPQPQDLQVEIAAISQLMQGKAIATLADLPLMEDRKQLAKVNIMANLLPSCYQAKPSLYPWLSCKMMQLSIQYGNTLHSSSIYSSYGIVCITLQDFTSAQEYGKLGCQLDLSPQTGDGVSGTVVMGVVISHYSTHVREAIPLLLKAYQVALDTGNFSFGGVAICTCSQYHYLMGDNLSAVKQEIATANHGLLTMKQKNNLAWNQAFEQAVLNLLGESKTPCKLIGTAYNETESVPLKIAANDRTALHFVYLNKLILCYLFDQIPQAVENAALAESYLDGVVGFLDEYVWNFYDSLTQLAHYADADRSVQKSILEKVETNQNKMQYWANHAPMNGQHKVDLVAAELHRVLRKRLEAIELYDRAITGAKENEYIQEEALANELAAKFYLNWGKEKIATVYMQEAYYCYARWGAKAKTNHLERRYPELLQPILQPVVSSTHWLDSLSNLAPAKVSVHSTGTVSSASGTNVNATLDFASVLKSSQAISDIIQLDDLLRELTRIMLQTSGGDRCVLALPNENGIWQVSAIASPDTIELYAEPLAQSQNAPIQLIYYVKNTHEAVVIDNLATDLPIIDAYLHQHQPQSVVCLPMLHHDTVVGVLYLHNQFTCGAFTSDRILILNFLCTQAAISIQNSCLYKELGRSLQDAQQKSQDLAEIVELSNGQQRILALIAQGVPLNTILEETARHIESQSRHRAYCSFLGLDREGRLRHLAAPSLPPAYNALVDGIKIGPEVGSCGTAAYYKASVTVEDIANDPLWANIQIALEYGLRACASTPILGSEDEVLATLAMYQPEPGEFTLHDRKLIEAATYLARIAIERHQADLEVQNLNFQMIQSEKMASLGNLVAGVAHEINNPIGFLNGSISNGKEYVQDLLEHLALYQQHYPNLADAIQDNAEEIDLEFLLEDLPQLLDAMQRASDRIQGISTSLRTFSRADTDHKVRANLHDGLDSTLLILKYRLKANEHRPEIEVIQDYGNLPEIDCFPGQLNQVFMNILANAIDAFDEVAQLSSFAELKDQRQIITIQTVLTEEKTVEIRIRDNGKGMPEEVKNRIFDHLFTTKGVGKGTGLGLSISRQIVEEKHGGKLACISALGAGTEFVISLPRL